MTTNPVTGKKKAAARVALPYWVGEFALIRTAVLTATAAITIGLTAVLVTGWRQQTADTELQRVQRVRDTAYSRYAHVDNEKRDIRNFQQRYIELRARGLIGDERRLEWVDAIRQTQEQLRLLPLSYEIDPQQPVRLESALDLGDYQLLGSRMRLHMDLLHEMDLFDFFSDLRERGFFAVQDCSIKRLGVSAGGSGLAGAAGPAGTAGAAAGPTLGADCTLNWITMTPVPKAPMVAGYKKDKA